MLWVLGSALKLPQAAEPKCPGRVEVAVGVFTVCRQKAVMGQNEVPLLVHNAEAALGGWQLVVGVVASEPTIQIYVRGAMESLELPSNR